MDLGPFLSRLREFSHQLSVSDRVWDILFPVGGKRWEHLRVVQYRRTFFLSLVHHEMAGLEVQPGGMACPMSDSGGGFGTGFGRRDSPDWESLLAAAEKWLEKVRKDWVQANRNVLAEYPIRFRCGIVPHAVVREAIPDLYRLDHELGRSRARKFVRMVEDGCFLRREKLERPAMTAAEFFRYCRIAYLAGKRSEETVDESLSGREMYERFADGRHEGLLDIPENSEKDFSDWIDQVHPLRTPGGHPWEIKRGGNTTHIDLAVMRPYPGCRQGFVLEVRAGSTSRLAEAIRMVLAIHEAGLPVSMAEPENVRKRILGLDNIGIVPAHSPLHRANQSFSAEDDVYDVLHLSDLGRSRRRLASFITWKPLPLLWPSRR